MSLSFETIITTTKTFFLNCFISISSSWVKFATDKTTAHDPRTSSFLQGFFFLPALWVTQHQNDEWISTGNNNLKKKTTNEVCSTGMWWAWLIKITTYLSVSPPGEGTFCLPPCKRKQTPFWSWSSTNTKAGSQSSLIRGCASIELTSGGAEEGRDFTKCTRTFLQAWLPMVGLQLYPSINVSDLLKISLTRDFTSFLTTLSGLKIGAFIPSRSQTCHCFLGSLFRGRSFQAVFLNEDFFWSCFILSLSCCVGVSEDGVEHLGAGGLFLVCGAFCPTCAHPGD